jgi:hypothetical protein
MTSALALALATALTADRPATPPNTPVMKTMMVLICCKYILSMAAMPDIGCVMNETEYRNMATDPKRINVKANITIAQILTSISSAVNRLFGLYPTVGITSSPVLV